MPKKELISEQHTLSEKLNLDRALLVLVTKNRRLFLTRMAIFFTKIGNGHIWLLFSIVVFFSFVPTGVSFLVATMLQLYAQIFIKTIIKRARPYRVYKDLVHLYDPPDPYSFPSGHTAAAFTMFFVSWQVIPMMAPFFFVIAVVIALSRIYLAVHYPSDVIAGIGIGYFSARIGIFITILSTGTQL
ncbi:MAG: phosphatase PAP2 family protein [Brevinema sp.]